MRLIETLLTIIGVALTVACTFPIMVVGGFILLTLPAYVLYSGLSRSMFSSAV